MQTHQAQAHAGAQAGTNMKVSHVTQHWQPTTSHSSEELCLGQWWNTNQSWQQGKESIQNVDNHFFSSMVRPTCENFKQQWPVPVFQPLQAQQQLRTQGLC